MLRPRGAYCTAWAACVCCACELCVCVYVCVFAVRAVRVLLRLNVCAVRVSKYIYFFKDKQIYSKEEI